MKVRKALVMYYVERASSMSVVLIVIILIGVFALLDFVRAVKGPTAVDRLVASSAISTKRASFYSGSRHDNMVTLTLL